MSANAPGDVVEAVIYFGWHRDSPVACVVRVVTPEVGEVACFECEGTGWWGYGPTPDECGPCVVCKGTRRIYVGL